MTRRPLSERAARTRILFLLPSLAGGGAERVVLTLLRELDRGRFDPVLVLVSGENRTYAGDLPPDVPVVDLACRRVRHALPRVVALIRRERPDVVFSTLSHLNLALALVRPLLPDSVRYVARESVVLSEILPEFPWPRLWRWAYRRFYPRFDRVVCQSDDMRRDLVERFGLPPAKAATIHNPVDTARIARLASDPAAPARDAGRIELVAAGRLTHQKGFDLLVEAIALCADPRLHVTVLGDGPMRERLVEAAAARGVAAQVEFAGFRANPYPAIAGADAFVLSSRFEGFPNVVLEALACGTPVVAMPAPGGIDEIARLAGGVLVADELSARGLADAIRRFVERRDAVPPGDVGPFTLERIVRRYEDLIAAPLPEPAR